MQCDATFPFSSLLLVDVWLWASDLSSVSLGLLHYGHDQADFCWVAVGMQRASRNVSSQCWRLAVQDQGVGGALSSKASLLGL